MKKLSAVALAILVAATLPACAAKAKKEQSSGGTSAVKVAVIYSKTGLLSAYGQEYLQGFNAGLAYATKGTGSVAGHKIDVTFADDAGTPSTAIASAKQYIGQGYKIIAGTTDSGIARQLAPLAEQNKVLYIDGPAAADALTGINKYTFRSGRQSYQDVATAGSFVGDLKGKKVLVFAQDTTFGQGNAAAVKAVLGAKGATVDSLLVPASTTDFTPFAKQAAQAKPQLVFVAWAGATTAPMWQALDQQKVLSSTTVVTGLANVASYGAYGPATANINFLSYYFPTAADNPVNAAMKDAITKAGGTPDLFSPDGFVAAQMIVHAIEKANGDEVPAMISALEGWTFDAPKGSETIRASDHAMLQPMFRAKLIGAGSSWTPQLVATVPATDTAPAAAAG
ncbi:MAG: substrate-binding domain-containing protein [Actinomycetota bacterium]|nr:substrate-binding domain-containing protein [Actinomycetota bacterium]MDQ2956998.1 substrate-binding domain-containing protein [Actinomycetota bacterium]